MNNKPQTIGPSLFSVPEITLSYRRNPDLYNKPAIRNSESCYTFLINHWDMHKIDYIEQVFLLMLDRKNICLGICELSAGGTSSAIVDPKVVFVAALKANASGIILAHNHPSQSVEPSKQDKYLTGRLAEAAKLLDVSFLDHLIVTPRHFFSFADEGLIP